MGPNQSFLFGGSDSISPLFLLLDVPFLCRSRKCGKTLASDRDSHAMYHKQNGAKCRQIYNNNKSKNSKPAINIRSNLINSKKINNIAVEAKRVNNYIRKQLI